jgi:threonine/homoserine/homoserine lactone efflux protein
MAQQPRSGPVLREVRQVFGVADYPAFIVAVLVFLMIPGPGTFALLAATGRGGLRAGAAATAGVIVGDQVLMWLAVIGVAAVLQTQPGAFKALQFAGAAYLCWVGLRLVLAGSGATAPVTMQPGHFFRQALAITLMNPKAIVFYMAFLPLFIDPARYQGTLTLATMAVTVASITAAYGLLLCVLADAVATRARAHRRLGDWLQRGAGAVLVGFGIRLGAN